MDPNDSFQSLMTRLRTGDDQAAGVVFGRYARRLIGLARVRLSSALQAKVDPEDVVQSVFRSFFRRHADGQFELRDWDGLWTMLTVITVRKCANVGKFYRREQRNVAREAAPPKPDDSNTAGWGLPDGEPTPDEAAMLAETVEELLSRMDERDRQIAALSLLGHSVQEIAEQVGYAQRTVRRTMADVKAHLKRRRDEESS